MGNTATDSIFDERRESSPSVRAVEQYAAGDKPPLKNPAEGMPEQLEEAEQDAEDPTHEKKVPPENEK